MPRPSSLYMSTLQPTHVRVATPPPVHAANLAHVRDTHRASVNDSDSVHSDESTRPLTRHRPLPPSGRLAITNPRRTSARQETRLGIIQAYSRKVLNGVWKGTEKLVTPITNEKTRPYVVGGVVAIIAGVSIGLTHGAGAAVIGALLLGGFSAGIAYLGTKGAWERDDHGDYRTGTGGRESRYNHAGMFGYSEDGGHNAPTSNHAY